MNHFFQKYDLTKDQKSLIQALDVFLSDPKATTFILKGYAGTGKTYMLALLTQYLGQSRRQPYVLAAPTGRAAKVISEKAQQPASTIHRMIYTNDRFEEFKGKNQVDSYKLSYKVANNEDAVNTLYIIDEASMLSDVYSEGEFFRFGSGYLLKDLVDYAGLKEPSNQRKLLLVGDHAQLPPVGMSTSPALSRQYLEEKYNIKAISHVLTDVVRQQGESGILLNATMLRQQLDEDRFNELDINCSPSDVQEVSRERVLDAYLHAGNQQLDEGTVCITHSNALANNLNRRIRAHFFGGNQNLAKGDRLMVVQNNYAHDVPLMNGELLQAMVVSERVQRRSISIKKEIEKGKVEQQTVILYFREVQLRTLPSSQNNVEFTSLIIDNLLHSNYPQLSPDEQKALYIDFKIRNEDVKPQTEEFRERLKNDPYFNALRLKFGYAITCHKAQGGEWNNAFVFCKTAMGTFNADYFRWLYTAITRAKSNLYLVEPPHYASGGLGLIKPTTLISQPRQDLIVLEEENLVIDLPESLQGQPKFLQLVYYAIFQIVKDEGVRIDRIKHLQYNEQYTFKKEQLSSTISIYYGSKDKISKLQPPNPNGDWISQLHKKLSVLEGKELALKVASTNTQAIPSASNFTFEEAFLETFYQQLLTAFQGTDIKVIDITSHKYQQVYTFEQSGLKAVIQFYYNGKQQFTRMSPNEQKSTSAELIQLISSKIDLKK